MHAQSLDIDEDSDQASDLKPTFALKEAFVHNIVMWLLKVEKSSYLYNRQYFTLYLHDSGAMVVYVIERLSKTRNASQRVDAQISQFSLNCLYTSDSYMRTSSNREGSAAAFHQGLHYLLRQKRFTEKIKQL